jgi:hypothetical protein
MPQINPNPHDEGYVYQPTHAVTGDFAAGVDIPAVQRELADAGFSPEQVQIFQGEAGADQLDLKGERHGGWVQFRRGLERVFADETMVFDRAEELLRAGGVVVVAFTGGDDGLKDRAVELLKARGGQPVRYWGEWTVDRP